MPQPAQIYTGDGMSSTAADISAASNVVQTDFSPAAEGHQFEGSAKYQSKSYAGLLAESFTPTLKSYRICFSLTGFVACEVGRNVTFHPANY